MNKLLLSLLTLCLALTMQAQARHGGNDNPFNTVSYRPLPSLCVNGQQGVSAAFAGSTGSKLLVAGGCNFPGTPAADGGDKQFYADIYELNLHHTAGTMQWRKIGCLPQPAAYGVGVSVPHGMVCVGGTSNGKQSLAKSYYLKSGHNHQLVIEALPALPQPLDNMAGAYGGGYIYVAGGLSNGS